MWPVRPVRQKTPMQGPCWFIAYAPAKNPSLVVVCVVEQGSYGSVSAAPIVQSILEYAFTTPGVKKPGSGTSKE